MPLSVKLTPDAVDDLVGIEQYTSENWGVVQSEKYLSGLQETINLLALSPELGIERMDVQQGIKSFPYRSHMLYYIQNEEHLVVFACLHQRMIPENHLGDRTW